MKDQWTERLSEYLDGELTGPERATLEAHVASCDACRTTLDELRRVVTNALARRPAAHRGSLAGHRDPDRAGSAIEGAAAGAPFCFHRATARRRIGGARAAVGWRRLADRETRDGADPTRPSLRTHPRISQRHHLPGRRSVRRPGSGSRARPGARPRPARHGDRARDRAESENHQPGHPRRAERARGRPRELVSEPAPRPRDAAETGAATPGGDTRRRAELGGG